MNHLANDLQHVNTNPTPSAATAAAQAFLANQKSNASLSNAAAAAALRSHVTSPTPVSEVQTKRILRRQSSASSNGSAPGSQRRNNATKPVLQRQGSSGSMTERTFREPSPNRGTPVEYYDDLPPIPALPRDYHSQQGSPPVPVKSHRRAASLEPPYRVGSPPPAKATGRGTSLDRGQGAPIGKVSAKRITSLPRVAEQGLDQPGLRGSVNFSYPLNGANSPPASPTPEVGQTFKQRPASKPPSDDGPAPVAELRPSEASTIQNAIQQSANAPVKKKKKKVAPSQTTEGSLPFAERSAGGRPRGTAVNSQAPANELTTTENAAPPQKTTKKKKQRAVEPLESSPQTPDLSTSSDVESIISEESVSERQKPMNTRAGALLSKQPSIVREERELEEQEASPSTYQQNHLHPDSTAIETSSPRTSFHDDSVTALQTPTRPGQKLTGDTTASVGARKSSLDQSIHAVHGRPQSLSPGRSARFSLEPPLMSPNVQRHQPPPRSLSPAKSALKQSPSPRTGSPAAAAGLATRPAAPPSDTSEVSAPSEAGSYEPGVQKKKKKNVRVSFDDDSVQYHDNPTSPDSAASPQLLSPQHKSSAKRSWFSLGRGKKNDDESTLETDEPDDLMKPRPALPSFGSVRGNKPREDGGEQLEKVTESVPQTTSESTPGSASDRVEPSSDHAIGGLLNDELAVTGTSTPSTEGDLSSDPSSFKGQGPSDPLPPEVTSVEGTGYHSDTTSSVATFEEEEATPDVIGEEAEPKESQQEQRPHPVVSTEQTPNIKVADEASTPPSGPDIVLPSIELVEPTPTLEDSRFRQEWLSIPGMFPESADPSDDGRSYEYDMLEHEPTEPTPANIGIAEPPPEDSNDSPTHGSTTVGSFASELQARSAAFDQEVSDDTGSSIYSDAAEDFSDLEGDGPVSPKMSPPATGTRPMKSSLRQTRPTSTPIMPAPTEPATKSRGHNRDDSSKSAPSSATTRPTKQKQALPLIRTTSNGSDSSVSSFRKARSRSLGSEGFAMRKTMRAPPIPVDAPRGSNRPGTADSTATGNRSSRLSLRSVSPTGSRLQGSDGHTMRSSLRSSTAGNTPSLRQNPPGDRRKSPSRFASFGKSSKQKTKPPKSKSAFASRFADSSDEEDGPAPFRSRFNDSSDDDDDSRPPAPPPLPLAPVRGIPRRIGEEDGESTDLEDSSEGETPRNKKAQRANNPPERSALAAGSLRRSGSGRDLTKGVDLAAGKKKRSIFGTLGRRKDSSKVQKEGGESLARRDTPLERSRSELQASANSPSAGRPKLVKRHTPKRMMSDSWPLTPTEGEDIRPSTSDGMAPSRPELGVRRATTPAPGEEPPTLTNGQAPKKEKKKRFKGLRKAFGLHD
ncbi:MAG: hypothetical protein M4579_004181 [Chaenotheca gracillima]|nr:MAG: hypothetical protein M4579_004181 [Chaenotheca gracillima]